VTALPPVRCAVIGLGMIGGPHAAVLAGSPLADLLGCGDLDPLAAGRAPDGVPFTSDPDELLENPQLEAVFVCTPQETHREVAGRALARGLSVFCEKPIAHTIDDADALIEAAAAAGPDRLVIGHTLRFDPDYLAMHAAVRSGAIGDVVSMAARRCVPGFEGRLIAGRTTLPVEVGVHDIDVLQWLAGEVTTVYAEAAGFGLAGPGRTDAVAGTLRFASGAVGVLDLNWIMPDPPAPPSDYRLAVFGTRGSAFAEFHAPPSRVFAGGHPVSPRTDEVYGSHTGTLRTEDEHFLRTVRGVRDWPLTLRDARSALAVALAMDRSASLGAPVPVRHPGARAASAALSEQVASAAPQRAASFAAPSEEVAG
jgi:UDP-N-acetylglucosamine 3-dehydrogenase